MILHQRDQLHRRTFIVDVLFVWFSVIVTAFFVSVVSAARLPSVVGMFVSQSLTLAVALLAAVMSMSLCLRMRMEQIWSDVRSLLPVACMMPVVASLAHIWNDGSGSMALSVRETAMFILTGGILPLSSGPNILLRGVVLTVLLCFSYHVWQRQVSIKAGIFAFVSGWLPAAAVLLIPTWMAFTAAAFRHQPVHMTGDADRVLGSVLTSSYWTNFQADRFFSGVGQQLETSIMLSSAAILFAIGLILLVILWQRIGYARHLVSVMRSHANDKLSVIVCLAAGIGYWFVFRMQRIIWNGFEISAAVVFIAMLVLWRVWWAATNEVDFMNGDEMRTTEESVEMSHALLFFMGVGMFVLGWPVALPIVTALIVGWCASAKGFGWLQNIKARPLIWGVLVVCFVMAGGAFAARSLVMPTALFGLAVAWASLVAAGISEVSEPSSWIRRLWPFILSCLICAWFLKLPIVIALGALCLLGLYKLQTKSELWKRYAFYSWVGFGIIVTCLKIFS